MFPRNTRFAAWAIPMKNLPTAERNQEPGTKKKKKKRKKRPTKGPREPNFLPATQKYNPIHFPARQPASHSEPQDRFSPSSFAWNSPFCKISREPPVRTHACSWWPTRSSRNRERMVLDYFPRLSLAALTFFSGETGAAKRSHSILVGHLSGLTGMLVKVVKSGAHPTIWQAPEGRRSFFFLRSYDQTPWSYK